MLRVTKFSITSMDLGGCIQFVFRIQKGRQNNKGFLTRLVVYLCVGVCIIYKVTGGVCMITEYSD